MTLNASPESATTPRLISTIVGAPRKQRGQVMQQWTRPHLSAFAEQNTPQEASSSGPR